MNRGRCGRLSAARRNPAARPLGDERLAVDDRVLDLELPRGFDQPCILVRPVRTGFGEDANILGAVDDDLGKMPGRLGSIPHSALRRICEQRPRVATAFWRSTLIDAAIYREWVTNVGRRDAYARTAHMLCELIVRLRFAGRIEDHVADLPITQAALGDAVGLSAVHVNRTLQALRGDGLIATPGTKLRALDWPGLVQAGEFDPTYLHLKDPEVAF
ncbi:Crp/Fnr family transcriptional regulator [Mesorhizobium sp.]|uniref:Crp/Fnr family transcriptional regulator n=1 Tax=Mesorhizobium sp. TaxID=1871066 RepID=UPI00257A0882|nr:Crp/Fnr family transcriptional regulator [Mesorhizobium sp.]